MASELLLWWFHATHYAPFTAVNIHQNSSMKRVIISLSAAPPGTLTIYTLPLWGNMLHLLSQFCSNVKTDVKVSGTEPSLSTALGLSSQNGWDSSSSQRETNTLYGMRRLKCNSVSQRLDRVTRTTAQWPFRSNGVTLGRWEIKNRTGNIFKKCVMNIFVLYVTYNGEKWNDE